MSHADFAAYVGEGALVGGYRAEVVPGFDCLHILRLDGSVELPLVFEPMEGFESRVEKVAAAVEGWARGSRAAA